MLVIRLQRTGRTNLPTYRLVVTEKTSPVRGRVQEYLGHYLPTRDPHVFECNSERVLYWVKLGAQPTDTASRLLHKAGVDGMDKFMKRYKKKRPKKEPPPEPVKAAVTPPPAPAAEPETA